MVYCRKHGQNMKESFVFCNTWDTKVLKVDYESDVKIYKAQMADQVWVSISPHPEPSRAVTACSRYSQDNVKKHHHSRFCFWKINFENGIALKLAVANYFSTERPGITLSHYASMKAPTLSIWYSLVIPYGCTILGCFSFSKALYCMPNMASIKTAGLKFFIPIAALFD